MRARPDDARYEPGPELALAASDLGRALDPARVMVDAGLSPDAWQAAVLRSDSKRQCWLCCRQSGKSTVAAAKSIHVALYEPGSLILLLSPSLRQSQEVFRKCLDLYRKLAGVPDLSAESALRLELPNASRIVSLPGSDSTVRGYSNVAMLIIDEAGHCQDSFLAAVLPSTATNRAARVLMLTTPNARAGMFYQIWAHDDTWEKTSISWRQCPRIGEEAVELYRRTAGELLYRREFENVFIDDGDSVFMSAIIEAALSDDVSPLFAV